MNKLTVGMAITLALVASTASAAGVSLTNGGFGQRASDQSTFGFAVCNNGNAALTASVPVSVTANGTTVVAQSSPSINAGACAYTYLPYSSFGMVGGHTYSVAVTVSGNSQTYNATVPGAVLGASTSNVPMSTSQLALMSTEVQLLQKLISLVKSALGQ